MNAFDLSKLAVTPDIHGEVGVWDASKSTTVPMPLGEKDLVRLVCQFAEQTGSVRVFATNAQCQAWLAGDLDV